LPFYLAIFTLLSLTGIIAYSWHIISQGDKSAVQIFYTILIGSAQIGVGSAIVTFNVMEVVVVLAGIIDQRFYRPRRERMRAEAMATGRAEGMAELQKKWEDWNRRRIEAGDGEFNEPPPTLDSNG
jgi:hypothetical protein